MANNDINKTSTKLGYSTINFVLEFREYLSNTKSKRFINKIQSILYNAILTRNIPLVAEITFQCEKFGLDFSNQVHKALDEKLIEDENEKIEFLIQGNRIYPDEVTFKFGQKIVKAPGNFRESPIYQRYICCSLLGINSLNLKEGILWEKFTASGFTKTQDVIKFDYNLPNTNLQTFNTDMELSYKDMAELLFNTDNHYHHVFKKDETISNGVRLSSVEDLYDNEGKLLVSTAPICFINKFTLNEPRYCCHVQSLKNIFSLSDCTGFTITSVLWSLYRLVNYKDMNKLLKDPKTKNVTMYGKEKDSKNYVLVTIEPIYDEDFKDYTETASLYSQLSALYFKEQPSAEDHKTFNYLKLPSTLSSLYDQFKIPSNSRLLFDQDFSAGTKVQPDLLNINFYEMLDRGIFTTTTIPKKVGSALLLSNIQPIIQSRYFPVSSIDKDDFNGSLVEGFIQSLMLFSPYWIDLSEGLNIYDVLENLDNTFTSELNSKLLVDKGIIRGKGYYEFIFEPMFKERNINITKGLIMRKIKEWFPLPEKSLVVSNKARAIMIDIISAADMPHHLNSVDYLPGGFYDNPSYTEFFKQYVLDTKLSYSKPVNIDLFFQSKYTIYCGYTQYEITQTEDYIDYYFKHYEYKKSDVKNSDVWNELKQLFFMTYIKYDCTDEITQRKYMQQFGFLMGVTLHHVAHATLDYMFERFLLNDFAIIDESQTIKNRKIIESFDTTSAIQVILRGWVSSWIDRRQRISTQNMDTFVKPLYFIPIKMTVYQANLLCTLLYIHLRKLDLDLIF